MIWLQRHGCTGWTDEVLDAIIDIGRDRGVVEIGAGNGQWARALMERYQMGNETRINQRRKKFDFVLAYDDQSELPLDQRVFNKKTKIHNEFFYNKVKKCDSNFSHALCQWQCRGRVLLLVYPPPGSMALDAILQYIGTSPMNDTVVYVGEGRGGANANDALFDQFESGEWVLLRVVQVKTFGSKGYEQLYILQRKSPDQGLTEPAH